MLARRVSLLWLVLGLALTGCGSNIAGAGTLARTANMPGSSDSQGGADSDAAADFTAGLLPAGQFGPDAVADPLSAADQADSDARQLPEGTVFSDPACATASEPAPPDPDVYAGQSVVLGLRRLYVQTVQSPFEGTPQDPRTYAGGLGQCQSGTVTLPNGTIVSIAFSALDVGDLGDLSGGRRMDSTAVTPDGQKFVTTMLSADVVDGERVVSLGMLSLVPNQPVDEVGFRELVATAYEYQHEALG